MRTFKRCDGSQNPGGGQQRVEGGEVQVSRKRHALPDELIHLHTDYAPSVDDNETFPDQ